MDDFNDAQKLIKENNFSQPKIHINLGEKMKITRVLNRYLTPVFSDKISKDKTGPGQMTRSQIVRIKDELCLHKQCKNFYLLGDPIKHSPSPTFHNKVFKLLNLSQSEESECKDGIECCKSNYKYSKFETSDLIGALYIINKPETEGCSVTIPLKRDLYEQFVDSASEDVKYIKAINTIVKIDGKIKVYNTDWIAIYQLLSQKLFKIYEQNPEKRTNKILIIGAGGTSLAAIYAVLQMNCIPIIYNRESSMNTNYDFMNEIWTLNRIPQFCHDLDLFKHLNDFSEYSPLIAENDSANILALSQIKFLSPSQSESVDAVIS